MKAYVSVAARDGVYAVNLNLIARGYQIGRKLKKFEKKDEL